MDSRCLLFCLLVLWPLRNQAASPPDLHTPIGFFTNVASRLLRAEMNLDLGRIQLYPTNQYTPAAHRLLQLTANLYDATTNRLDTGWPYLPTVFRPQFTNDGGAIFVTGYVEESTTNFWTNAWRDLTSAEDRDGLRANDNVTGIPLLIGARKGLPNFNEFSVESVFQITRRMRLVKASPLPPRNIVATNLMYGLGLSNIVGVEAWYPYSTNYPRAVSIQAVDLVAFCLTNDVGLRYTQNVSLAGSLVLGTNQWVGMDWSLYSAPLCLQLPLLTNLIFLPDASYHHEPSYFTNLSSASYETNLGFPEPKWAFNAAHHFRFLMVDVDTGRPIEVVNLAGPQDARNLSAEIRDTNAISGFSSLWNTNRLGGTSPDFLTLGMWSQFALSLGVSPDSQNQAGWLNNALPLTNNVNWSIDNFRVFLGYSPMYYPSIVNTNLTQELPLVPVKKLCHYISWQANDPFIHALTNDLISWDWFFPVSFRGPVPGLRDLGDINDHFRPWGGNPYKGPDADPATAWNVALKDPQVWDPNFWDFPSGEAFGPGMIGRVHRGTPWQTVYLKSLSTGITNWQAWTGNPDPVDAAHSMPTNDWHLLDILFSLWNTNPPAQLLSPNSASVEAWSAALDGLNSLTNSAMDGSSYYRNPTFDNLVLSSNAPPATTIASALCLARAAQSGGYFHAPGEILSVPELSTNTPCLFLSSEDARLFNVTDLAYEIVPSQLLAKLKPDSVGTIVQTGARLQANFTGLEGFTYLLQSSTNFTDWETLSTNSPFAGSFRCDLPPSDGKPRFYRSLLLP